MLILYVHFNKFENHLSKLFLLSEQNILLVVHRGADNRGCTVVQEIFSCAIFEVIYFVVIIIRQNN